MVPRRLVALLAAPLAIAASVSLSGCGIAAGVSSHATLTIYNGQHPQTTDALVAAFTKKTGIKVRIRSDDEDLLAAQLDEEGDRTPADIYYTENSNWLALVDKEGLLAKVEPSTLANIPSRDSAADGDWVGITARVSCLIYNTNAIKASQVPTTIMQLASPKWYRRLGIDAGETDFWPIVDSVYTHIGRAATINWIQHLKSNAGLNDHIPDNETLTADVNRGTVDLGVINQYYYYRLMAEIGRKAIHSRIAFFAPGSDGYVEDISGAAILRASKHKHAAQEFLNFMTSAEGQRIIADSDSFEYPLRHGISANSEMTPLDKLHPTAFTPAQLGTGQEGEKLLQQAGVL